MKQDKIIAKAEKIQTKKGIIKLMETKSKSDVKKILIACLYQECQTTWLAENILSDLLDAAYYWKKEYDTEMWNQAH